MSRVSFVIKPRIRLHAVTFSLIVSVYFFFGLNLPFMLRMGEVGRSEILSGGFLFSIPVFFIAAFNIIFSGFSNNRARKPVFMALVMFSSLVSYATYNYGVIFSKEMIANIAETNVAEAVSYLNYSLVFWVCIFGVAPSIAIFFTEIIDLPAKKIMLSQLYSVIVSMFVISIIAMFYYQDYAVTIRNNSDLKKIIVPTYVASSGYKFIKEKYFTRALPYTQVGGDARQAASAGNRKSLTVLVVGETARAVNYSLNGHRNDTNRYTRPFDVTFFKNVTSCGTETAVSVPCMFSNLTRAGYSLQAAAARDNLLDVMQRAGIQIIWLDNNGGCKGVCGHVKSVDMREAYGQDQRYCGHEGCLDGAFLPEMKKQIAGLKQESTVIVLHLMGSHGPAYYKRYPADMAVFKPDCQRSDIQNCDAKALENTYDNSILYTDKLLSDIIATLKENEPKWDVSMLYLSDHGESLGEKGFYLHGIPYAIAPEEQKRIPMMAWFSDGTARDLRLNINCIAQNESKPYSQDNLFHTMLGLLQVSTEDYRPDLDLFASCRNKRIAGR